MVSVGKEIAWETMTEGPAEVPVYIPSRAEHLGGVVTVPDDPQAATAVVLMAGRARDRAHRNGMWVKAAHELARLGMYALRLDYPGVGNSTGRPQIFPLESPPVWAVQDACRFLLEQTPARRILLVATCYGGRLVLDAAPTIPEVEGVAIVASPTFVRIPTLRRRIRNRLREALGRPDGPPAGVVSSGRNRIEQQREQNLALERRVSPAFTKALRRFVRRGRVYFLYGDRDFLYEEIRFALDRIRPPADRVELEIVPGDIHVFRTVAVQDLTVEKVVGWCARIAGSTLEDEERTG
jgi:pimeloyl-ACP methyl ester carboxylesterase